MNPPVIHYVEPVGILGGMEGYNRELIRALLERGVAVHYATSSAPALDLCRPVSWAAEHYSESQPFGRAMNRAFPRPLRLAAYIQGWIRVLSAARPGDILLTHFFHVPPADKAFIRGSRCRHVHIAHDPEPPTARRMWTIQCDLLRSASKVIAHGPRSAADLVQLNVDPDRISVRKHGDFVRRTPSKPSSTYRTTPQWLRQLRSTDQPTILVVGHLKRTKNLDKLVGLWPRISDATGCRLVIVGRASNDFKWSRRATQVLAHHPSITWLDQSWHPRDEGRIYSSGLAIIIPYESAYASGVLATAHKWGRPVIVVPTGDTTLQVSDSDIVMEADWSDIDLQHAVEVAMNRGETGGGASRDFAWSEMADEILC